MAMVLKATTDGTVRLRNNAKRAKLGKPKPAAII